MHLLSSRDVIHQKIDANDKRIVPASPFLIYIRPKKDTGIIRIDSNLAVVLYLFCKYILHASTRVSKAHKLAQGVRVSNI